MYSHSSILALLSENKYGDTASKGTSSFHCTLKLTTLSIDYGPMKFPPTEYSSCREYNGLCGVTDYRSGVTTKTLCCPPRSSKSPLACSTARKISQCPNFSIATLTYAMLKGTLMTKLVNRQLASNLLHRRRVAQISNISILLAHQPPAPTPELRTEHRYFGVTLVNGRLQQSILRTTRSHAAMSPTVAQKSRLLHSVLQCIQLPN
jgi:hypothetical protein